MIELGGAMTGDGCREAFADHYRDWITWTGPVRDTILFSDLRDEWR